MKKIGLGLVFAGAFTLLNLSSSASACTDFRVTAKDGTVLITRSMEFAEPFNSNLRSSPRGRTFTATAPDGKPGMTWKSKYGYLYLDGMNIDAAVDGMNEQGLSFEALLFPGEAQYQDVAAEHDAQAIPYMSLGNWILGNFQNVDEVRQALQNVSIFAQTLPTMGNIIFPLHFAIYDSTGKSIVVEYVAGKMNIYDNKIGVMTNSPTYDWHVTNLRNYVNLSPLNPSQVIADGLTFTATGQGSGMKGLPGDISPPSRFIKTATLMHVAITPDNAAGALNLAEHVINNVDIPLGLAREAGNGKSTNETTQWVVFKDLTHKMFYYRTYNDLSLHGVSMAKVDFSENATPLKMPIASKEYIADMSTQFLQQKAG